MKNEETDKVVDFPDENVYYKTKRNNGSDDEKLTKLVAGIFLTGLVLGSGVGYSVASFVEINKDVQEIDMKNTNRQICSTSNCDKIKAHEDNIANAYKVFRKTLSHKKAMEMAVIQEERRHQGKDADEKF